MTDSITTTTPQGQTTKAEKLTPGTLVVARLEDGTVHEFAVEFQDDDGAVKISRWISRDRVHGQTVPGKPGRVITGRGPLWSSSSGTPDPITRKPDLFPTFPSDDEF